MRLREGEQVVALAPVVESDEGDEADALDDGVPTAVAGGEVAPVATGDDDDSRRDECETTMKTTTLKTTMLTTTASKTTTRTSL
jgi:hypothetical protein